MLVWINNSGVSASMSLYGSALRLSELYMSKYRIPNIVMIMLALKLPWCRVVLLSSGGHEGELLCDAVPHELYGTFHRLFRNRSLKPKHVSVLHGTVVRCRVQCVHDQGDACCLTLCFGIYSPMVFIISWLQ